VDDVDRRILAFIGAHRFVLALYVQAFLELEPRVAADRLRGLEAERLVRSERLLAGRAGSIRITDLGLAAIGSRLPVPGFVLGGYRHEVGVVWVWVAAWRGMFGEAERVLSRREMEGLDRAVREAGEGAVASGFAVPVGRGATPGSAGWCYPDVALETSGGRVAIHLQLRVPGSAMLEGLLAGYRSHDRVLFLTDERRVAEAVQGAAARFGVRDRVRVQRVTIPPIDDLARTEQR
jgi:hypothetical protein